VPDQIDKSCDQSNIAITRESPKTFELRVVVKRT
jgi:hypothetical protein